MITLLLHHHTFVLVFVRYHTIIICIETFAGIMNYYATVNPLGLGLLSAGGERLSVMVFLLLLDDEVDCWSLDLPLLRMWDLSFFTSDNCTGFNKNSSAPSDIHLLIRDSTFSEDIITTGMSLTADDSCSFTMEAML